MSLKMTQLVIDNGNTAGLTREQWDTPKVSNHCEPRKGPSVFKSNQDSNIRHAVVGYN
jgi:hypothetical protein